VSTTTPKSTSTTKTTSKTTIISTTTATEFGSQSGLVLTGGDISDKSVEVWSPDSGHVCSGPNLPDRRRFHSADFTSAGVVVCGGLFTRTSCLAWAPGTSTWTHYATIQTKFKHVSWLSSTDQLVLIGGNNGSKDLFSTDIVGVYPGFAFSTEIVGVYPSITLQRPTRTACLINKGDKMLLTGGISSGSSLTNVDQYDVNNFIKSFPSLQQPRQGHTCGDVSGV
jgi:hypothetical protein